MKIKPGFLLQTVAGSHIVVPTEEADAEFNGMITLNDTGAFLWKHLETETTEEQLVAVVMKTYEDVDEAFARSCVSKFVQQVREAGCLA